jgi:hypothetical protein
MRTSALVYLFVAACGGGGGSNPDAKTPDAPPGGKTFHISGIATQQAAVGGGSPAKDVVVAAFATANENTAVAMATSDATGAYMITVNSPTMTLDGFLKATKTGNVDTYLYPPAPLTMDFMNASVNELDTNLFAFLNDPANNQCNNAAGQALIVLEVFDAAMMPVAGVAVTSTPAAPRTGYTGAGGLPDFAGTGTAADGRAFLCQLPAGAVTVTGTKAGVTFKTTSLKTHAGAFTTTIVTE